MPEDEASSGSSGPAAAGASSSATSPTRIVVIGAGGAGMAAVESLRKTAPAAEIVLISQETELPYYRLNLTRYLAGEINRPELFIHPAAWYQEQQVQLLLGTEVSALHLAEHAVQLGDGRRLPFDKLLLAAGANPFIPPISGANRHGVTSLRTVQDADYLLKACEAGARCVCIGGGLLGLEAAGALARRGAQVTLLEGHGWLLPRQLNERAGQILGEHVGRIGITLRRKAKTREILGDEHVRSILLEDGSTVAADVVVIATGVRSNCSLAQQAGLEVKHGVLVNNQLLTSHPDVLAAGDVAEHNGVVYGLWTASQAQGAIAGRNLAGAGAEFTGLPRSSTLKVLGLDLFSIGQIMPPEAGGQVIEQETGGRYYRFVFQDGRLVGAILLGDTQLMAVTKKAVEEKRDCTSVLRAGSTAQSVMGYLGEAGSASLRLRPAGHTPGSHPPADKPAASTGGRRYRCPVCGYVYDEQQEAASWAELPDDWVCPGCGAPKSTFVPEAPEVGGPSPPVSGGVTGKLALAHRVFGYVFLALYVLLMWEMVPRLWTYQIELPARTVMHMSLGIAVGVILLLKISIVRFFKRLDAALVPALGTSLLVGSTVLIGIAVPPAFREALATGRLFTDENRRRVEALLVQTGLDQATSAALASPALLRAGQEVLRQQCIECHDLRTVIARPRTPDGWRQTVRRMADLTSSLTPISEDQQWQVTAYLVALSPQLQQSAQRLRDQAQRREGAQQAAESLTAEPAQAAPYDAALAKRLFETKCSECHATDEVDQAPPDSENAARDLVTRMVEEGMTADEEELAQIVRYLTDTYVKKSDP
ncbi:MAG TPA: FAD-dependent oxidoreductase [Candidatus Anammoximicrobium sp.]|nr:FAD-dependent oxidoreductase [Candidatus Anammoximicrobium sp.]